MKKTASELAQACLDLQKDLMDSLAADMDRIQLYKQEEWERIGRLQELFADIFGALCRKLFEHHREVIAAKKGPPPP